jgi:hypothetical protein
MKKVLVKQYMNVFGAICFVQFFIDNKEYSLDGPAKDWGKTREELYNIKEELYNIKDARAMWNGYVSRGYTRLK